MPVFFEGTLKAIAKKSFDDAEGTHVEYFELYFQGETPDGDPSVLKVNTKQDMSDSIDLRGVVELSMRETGSPKFISFKVATGRSVK